VPKTAAKTSANYEARSIQVLKGLDAVKKRPAMYIGSTGARGLHHLFVEVTDNCIDEVLAGYCTAIDCTIHKDGSISVEDNGRGIPVDKHPEVKKPGVEVAMTMLHAGSKFGGGGYKVSGGLHGVGVSVVNALSEWLEVEVSRDGKKHHIRFERGVTVSPLKVTGKAKKTGTLVRYKADPKIFETTEINFEQCLHRLRELAYLNPAVKITLTDERTGAAETFQHKGGISAFVEHLNRAKVPLHRPIYFKGSREDTEVEIALQYNDAYLENLLSYANNIHTSEGGTHVSGFKTALTRVINTYTRKAGLLKEKDSNFAGDDVREGLTAIISVKLLAPQFEGQTKTKLGNSDIEGLVNSIVGEKLAAYLEEHPPVARKIADKAITASRAREAARKAADLIKRKSALETTGLPGRLWDCSERDPSKCEIFLVEGPSAGGSAKQSRDSRYQAILPLRGVVLNVEKARLDRVLSNGEIATLISALGTGIHEHSSGNGNGNGNGDDAKGESASKFDLSRLRYHKVIVMADADVDGAHIRTLLLTFFYRFMRPLIERGHLYIALPPLYGFKNGKEMAYAHSDQELEKLLKKTDAKKVHVQRYKGLGEMDAEELAETTMDPTKRHIVRVNVEDAAAADEIFSTLMGEIVEPRKEFIVRYAKEVKNLDLAGA
jgi:DNA gyrase subunit B